jgi:hypothetical protein
MGDVYRRAVNIDAVRTYLKNELPGRDIYDWHDAKSDAHGFRVNEKSLPDIEVAHELLDDKLEADRWLGTLGLAAMMRRTPKTMTILVTRTGLSVRPRRE